MLGETYRFLSRSGKLFMSERYGLIRSIEPGWIVGEEWRAGALWTQAGKVESIGPAKPLAGVSVTLVIDLLSGDKLWIRKACEHDLGDAKDAVITSIQKQWPGLAAMYTDPEHQYWLSRHSIIVGFTGGRLTIFGVAYKPTRDIDYYDQFTLRRLTSQFESYQTNQTA